MTAMSPSIRPVYLIIVLLSEYILFEITQSTTCDLILNADACLIETDQSCSWILDTSTCVDSTDTDTETDATESPLTNNSDIFSTTEYENGIINTTDIFYYSTDILSSTDDTFDFETTDMSTTAESLAILASSTTTVTPMEFESSTTSVSSSIPTLLPSTILPSALPTIEPSMAPTPAPVTASPTIEPSMNTTPAPVTTNNPTQTTNNPTQTPSVNPTMNPSMKPSNNPTNQPSISPTNQPSISPSTMTTTTTHTAPSTGSGGDVTTLAPTQVPIAFVITTTNSNNSTGGDGGGTNGSSIGVIKEDSSIFYTLIGLVIVIALIALFVIVGQCFNQAKGYRRFGDRNYAPVGYGVTRIDNDDII